MFKQSTIVALVVAAACVALAVALHRQDQSSDPPVEARRPLFDPGLIPVDSLERVTLRRGQDSPMEFVRQGGQWLQRAPVKHPVDPFSMRQFAMLADQLVVAATAEMDAASASLDPPLAVLTLTWEGGDVSLAFGRVAAGGRAYLRVDEGPIVLVNRDLHDRVLDDSPNEWRTRRLFELAGIESTLIAFEPNGFVLRRDRRRWGMVEPVRTRVDQALTEEYVALVGDLRCTEFVVDDPADLAAFGLENPIGTLTVVTPVRGGDGTSAELLDITETLLIGDARDVQGESRYAMIEGRSVVVAVGKALIDRIRAIGGLIELTGTGVDPADVKSMRLSGETEFTVSRDENDPAMWRMADEPANPKATAAAEALLEHLARTRAESVEQREYPLDREVAYVTMFGFNGGPLDTVRIARESDTGPWLLDNGDTLLRLLPAGLEMPLSPEAFAVE